MTPEFITIMFHEAIKVLFIVAIPLLLVALIVGFIISLLQAATQINEQTLSFIPKIIAVFITIIMLGPWMLHIILNYISTTLKNIPLAIN